MRRKTTSYNGYFSKRMRGVQEKIQLCVQKCHMVDRSVFELSQAEDTTDGANSASNMLR